MNFTQFSTSQNQSNVSEKRKVKVSEASSNLDFTTGGNIFGNEYAYNILRTNTTILTTPSVIIFANGELTSKDSIQIEKAVWTDNPSEYLDNNQELAKKVEQILIVPCFALETNPSMDEAGIAKLKNKYNGFINSLTNK